MLSLLLSLVLPQEFTVPLARVDGAKVHDVASAQVQQPVFAPTAAGLATTATFGGRKVPLLLPGPVDQLAKHLWLDLDADGIQQKRELVDLAWDGTWAELDLQPFGTNALLAIFRNAIRTGATLRTRYHFDGTFDAAGKAIAVRVVDMDGDGAPSRGDRWLALPKEQLDTLMQPNNMFVARETDEPWHFGDRELQLVRIDATAITLRIATLSRPRHEFLAARADRVAAWFGRDFDAQRDDLFATYKIDKDRPRTTPVAWYHTFEFADARRFAKAQGQPLLVEFSRDGCGFCKLLPWASYPDAAVAARLQRFACVRLDTELDLEHTAETLGHRGVPVLILFDGDGKPLHTIGGFRPPQELVPALDAALQKAQLPPVRD